MNHDAYPDNYIRGILNSVKSIAMVGADISKLSTRALMTT
jgi:predicted CoA-binding protein